MTKDRVPLISIVGTSKSGKTTFIERLTPVFRDKGLRIASIKHHHLNFEIDKAGKDTYRHMKAGASTVVLSSPYKIAIIRDVEREVPLKEIVHRYIEDVDVVITEGYKKEDVPKIEIFRAGRKTLPLCFDDDTILAVVTDEHIETSIPQFRMSDIKNVAKFIDSVLQLNVNF
jgi:molybdopterin-guanine dinucleotide biosynthesis protein B